jgi:hypothetical protein
MAKIFDSYGDGLAMPSRLDGYSVHIAPRADYALPIEMARLKTLGSVLWMLNLLHLVLVTIGLLSFLYCLTYYYLIQAFDYPQDFVYLKINEIHRQVLSHSIGERDVAYFFLLLFVFIIDNIILQAAKCMRNVEDHSLAVIGSFLACIPVLNMVSLPFGLMALILLLKPPVEKKFC